MFKRAKMVDIPDSSFLKSNFNEKIESNTNSFLDEESDPMDPLTYSGSETTATINEEQFFDASDQPLTMRELNEYITKLIQATKKKKLNFYEILFCSRLINRCCTGGATVKWNSCK